MSRRTEANEAKYAAAEQLFATIEKAARILGEVAPAEPGNSNWSTWFTAIEQLGRAQANTAESISRRLDSYEGSL